MKARLHPVWVGGRDGYRYSVLFDGKLFVDRSREPELDAARAFLARGITGKLTICDGKTGKSRTIIDIEKAARLTVKRDPTVLDCYGRRHAPTHRTATKRIKR